MNTRRPDYVEIRVTKSWVRFIKWVASVVPNGDVKIKFVNGEPTKLLEYPSPDIRFDKEYRMPEMLSFEFDSSTATELVEDLTKPI